MFIDYSGPVEKITPDEKAIEITAKLRQGTFGVISHVDLLEEINKKPSPIYVLSGFLVLPTFNHPLQYSSGDCH